ncbi:putative protein kinase RLK-Pelle-LRR-VIII-1 family [Helianthus debilis subsp. tardiflorus]
MPRSRITERDGRKESDVIEFSFDAIVIATNDFSDENKLGQGGFGPVYMGKLSDEQEIAVRRLSRTSRQGLNEFRNELRLDARLQHTNLVQVLGCCIHGEEKILIYEYMPNKSLDFFLFGLLYLHKYARTQVVHRDLKASKVLLDECMNPKISDFGMEMRLKQRAKIVGYIPPEGGDGYYSVKTDVFSFGVLILEIVTCKSSLKSNSSTLC